MNKDRVAVLTDSGCDVPQNFREKYNIFMLPLRVMYPEKDYEDGVNIDPIMVYRRFPDEYPSTSTPSLAEVQDIFDEIREAGYEKIIAVTISSGLSGTFNTIRLAADIVVAATSTTGGFGCLAILWYFLGMICASALRTSSIM